MCPIHLSFFVLLYVGYMYLYIGVYKCRLSSTVRRQLCSPQVTPCLVRPLRLLDISTLVITQCIKYTNTAHYVTQHTYKTVIYVTDSVRHLWTNKEKYTERTLTLTLLTWTIW
jgi:hypothetical protein